MRPAYPRAEMERLVCGGIEAGATLDALAARARLRDDRLLDLGVEMAQRCITPATVEADKAQFAAMRQRLGQLSGGAPRKG